MVLIEGFQRRQNPLSKVTAGENRTGGQRAKPLPDCVVFLYIDPYRFLVHRTFTQPSVRMTAADFLEIIPVILATCHNRKFCCKGFSSRKKKNRKSLFL